MPKSLLPKGRAPTGPLIAWAISSCAARPAESSNRLRSCTIMMMPQLSPLPTACWARAQPMDSSAHNSSTFKRLGEILGRNFHDFFFVLRVSDQLVEPLFISRALERKVDALVEQRGVKDYISKFDGLNAFFARRD